MDGQLVNPTGHVTPPCKVINPNRVVGSAVMVCFSPDGQSVYAAGSGVNGGVGGWDAVSGKHEFSLGYTGEPKLSSLLADNVGNIYFVDSKNRIHCWSVAKRSEVGSVELKTPGEISSRIAGFSPKGGSAFVYSTGLPAGLLFHWNVATGKTELIYDVAKSRLLPKVNVWHSIMDAAVSGDGKHVAVHTNQRVIVADGTGKELNVIDGIANSLTFSPDNSCLLCASNKLRFFKPDGSVLLSESPVYKDAQGADFVSRCGGFSDDGRYYVAGLSLGNEQPGWVVVWDVKNRRQVCTFKGAEADLLSVACSPDAHRVATADSRGNVFVWDITQQLAVPAGASGK